MLQPLAVDCTRSSWAWSPRPSPSSVPGPAASRSPPLPLPREGQHPGRRRHAGAEVAGTRTSGRKRGGGTLGGSGRVSVTHFLASAPKAEKRGARVPRVCAASRRGGCWPPGRAFSEPRAMASEAPREPVGEVRTAPQSGGRASGRRRAGDSAGRRGGRGYPGEDAGARECAPAPARLARVRESGKRWLKL